MKRRLQFRILPTMLVVAGLLLVGKIGAVLFEADSPDANPSYARQIVALESISPAAGKTDSAKSSADPKTDGSAAEKPKDKTDAKKAKDGAPDKSGEKAGGQKNEDIAAAHDTATAEGAGKASSETSDGTATSFESGDENFDPMMLSRAEIELLLGLSKRRAAIEERERAFTLKEQTLAAAEQKLDEKIKALEELKQTVEALLAKKDQQEEDRLKSLVKIYESMKPKEAAAILGGLEQNTLLDVIERMKESKSAPILALIEPARAKMVTEELIARRRVPKPETNS